MAYKSDVLGGDIVVDAVSRAGLAGPAAFGEALAGTVRVVAHEARALHQEVEDEACQLHADGDEEEDDGVLLLVRQQQLGEDAAERDDDPGGAWGCGGAVGAGPQLRDPHHPLHVDVMLPSIEEPPAAILG